MVRFTRRRQYRVRRRRMTRRMTQRGGALQDDLEGLLVNHNLINDARGYMVEHDIRCIHSATPVRGEDGTCNVILIKEIHGANNNDLVPTVVFNIGWDGQTFNSVDINMWETSPATLLDEEAFATEKLADADPKCIAILNVMSTVFNAYMCQ